MKITIFSSNQPRHLNLVKQLSHICDEVFFVSEVKTLFPGIIDDKVGKSPTMETYFSNVLASERSIFGDIDFLPSNVKTLGIKSGDLIRLNKSQLYEAMNSDFYIIFGASYIKGWLIDFLLEQRAINIHIGLAPYYRGSSCNFWALYDNKPNFVGATIHFLSKGLDSGDILFHCIPKLRENDSSFDFTMRSVMVAHQGLVNVIDNKKILTLKGVKQDNSKEIRYSKHKDFTDKVADEFLQRKIILNSTLISYPKLLRPIFG